MPRYEEHMRQTLENATAALQRDPSQRCGSAASMISIELRVLGKSKAPLGRFHGRRRRLGGRATGVDIARFARSVCRGRQQRATEAMR